MCDFTYTLIVLDPGEFADKKEVRDKLDSMLKDDGMTTSSKQPDRETWGTTPDAIAGQNAAMAMVASGGKR